MKDKYSVYSDFDVRKHKKHFTDYLEVIIHPDGSVHYAVPSHSGIYDRLYMQTGQDNPQTAGEALSQSLLLRLHDLALQGKRLRERMVEFHQSRHIHKSTDQGTQRAASCWSVELGH